MSSLMTIEQKRLLLNSYRKIPLEQWGPYLSERQWGTVREDYSPYGDAWHYFPYDHAHCRHINGGKTDWQASPIFFRTSALLLPYGTERIPY